MAKRARNIAGNGRRVGVVPDTIQYVLPLGGNGWVVKSSNAAKFTVITDSKREAVSVARKIAKAQHIKLEIHNRDGRIEKSESYAI